jgi:hypothetical protein
MALVDLPLALTVTQRDNVRARRGQRSVHRRGTRFGTYSPATRSLDRWSAGVCWLFEMERTGIEPVTSGLQTPGFEPRLGQIRSVNAKLR